MQQPSKPKHGSSTLEVLVLGIALAAVIELFTCFVRFGLGLQSTRDTSWIAGLTFGYRIHHGYIGVAILVAAIAFFRRSSRYRYGMLILGFGLIFSDLFHHFAVLWPLTGSPQFDFRYP